MVNPQATGCEACNPDIARAVETMPTLPGYLSTDDYGAKYWHLPPPWPKPHVDAEYILQVTDVVLGDDGWILANHPRVEGQHFANGTNAHPCECGSNNIQRDLYRGKVTLE